MSSALVGARSRETIDKNLALCEDTSKRVDLDWLHTRKVDVEPKAWEQPG